METENRQNIKQKVKPSFTNLNTFLSRCLIELKKLLIIYFIKSQLSIKRYDL